ncbi:hypothetical protein HPB50_022247 [Hyalomma asiaticum]|uniref:Uncharacterized protein n=1 Tax=Hyalomma asiaticum TaxID=266040 RepID=A0ACB7S8C9_HYAAI|nr:hypothetical protein HPB50_022247 [Hyalomma asiaticum]
MSIAAAQARAQADASRARAAFSRREAAMRLEKAKIEAELEILQQEREVAAAEAQANALEAAAEQDGGEGSRLTPPVDPTLRTADASRARAAFSRREAAMRLEKAKIEAELEILQQEREVAAAEAQANALEAAAEQDGGEGSRLTPPVDPTLRTVSFVAEQEDLKRNLPLSRSRGKKGTKGHGVDRRSIGLNGKDVAGAREANFPPIPVARNARKEAPASRGANAFFPSGARQTNERDRQEKRPAPSRGSQISGGEARTDRDWKRGDHSRAVAPLISGRDASLGASRKAWPIQRRVPSRAGLVRAKMGRYR